MCWFVSSILNAWRKPKNTSAKTLYNNKDEDGLSDVRQMAVQLLLCEVLLQGFVPNSMQHSSVAPIKLIFQALRKGLDGAAVQYYRHDHSLEEFPFSRMF